MCAFEASQRWEMGFDSSSREEVAQTQRITPKSTSYRTAIWVGNQMRHYTGSSGKESLLHSPQVQIFTVCIATRDGHVSSFVLQA